MKTKRESWEYFRSTGLLVVINQMLHIFGWSIIFSFTQDGKLKDVYPGRVDCFGFDEETIEDTHNKLMAHMKDNAKSEGYNNT